jgi:signal peptidase I
VTRPARLGCGFLLAAAAVTWTRRRWTVVVVRGSSMAPTLQDGDRLLVRRGSTPPDRGDVVVFRHAESGAVETDPALRVKRVAAVAGDPMPAWVSEGAAVDHRLRAVPAGHLVVRGDARLSQDSRQLGLVPVSALVGALPDPRRHVAAWRRGRRRRPTLGQRASSQ